MKRVFFSICITILLLHVGFALCYAQGGAKESWKRGVLFGVQGKFTAAKISFEKALKINPSDSSARICLEVIIDVINQRIKKEVAVHYFKGESYWGKGMWDEAISEFSQAIVMASQNGYIEIIKLLLEANVDVNQTRIKNLYIPLLMASQNGHTEIVKLLLEANADVNKADIQGRTPLIMASGNGQTEVVKLLLEAKADMNKATETGFTPLIMATATGHTEIVKLLLEANVDVNKADKDDETPLLTAVQYGHTEIVKLLLEANTDVNKADIQGRTPVFLASEKGQTEVVKLLLEAKADVNKARIKDGVTPLLMAAQKHQTEVVKLLLEAKADVNKADKDDFTPLLIAAQEGHTEIVKILEKFGTKSLDTFVQVEVYIDSKKIKQLEKWNEDINNNPGKTSEDKIRRWKAATEMINEMSKNQ